jgi:hypothetical protein
MLSFLDFRFAACALAGALGFVWAETQGVYSPDYRWTKAKTIAQESESDPVTLTACWKQKADYSYFDDSWSGGIRVAVFDFKSMMDGVETAVRTSWVAYCSRRMAWQAIRFPFPVRISPTAA